MAWLMLSLCLAALAAAERTIEATEGALLTCAPGETVILKVSSDFSNGSIWYFVGPEKGPVTLLNGSTGTFAASESGLPGSPGAQLFTLACSSAASEGDLYAFMLVNRVSWRAEDTVARDLVFRITNQA